MKAITAMAASALAGVLAMMPATGAQAEGWYFGLSGGASSFDVKQGDFDLLLDQQLLVLEADLEFESPGVDFQFTRLPDTSSLDDSDTAWGAFVGYRWRYVAAEVGYLNLGKASYRADVLVEATDGVDAISEVGLQTGRAVANGAFASLLGVLPVGERFDLFVRGGIVHAKTTLDFTDVFSTKGSSNDLYFGVGADWNFSERFGARIEYNRFLDVGDENVTGEFDMDLVSVSLLFR